MDVVLSEKRRQAIVAYLSKVDLAPIHEAAIEAAEAEPPFPAAGQLDVRGKWSPQRRVSNLGWAALILVGEATPAQECCSQSVSQSVCSVCVCVCLPGVTRLSIHTW